MESSYMALHRIAKVKMQVKEVLASGGLLGYMHRIRNRQTLTCVVFHRVLPKERLSSPYVDKQYVVELEMFKQCLDFFCKHYNPISLSDILNSVSGTARLPQRALHITFDDGWRDNLNWAIPVLQERNLPVTIFIATEAVRCKERSWWQNSVITILKDARLKLELIDAIKTISGNDVRAVRHDQEASNILWNIYEALVNMPEENRSMLLQRLAPPRPPLDDAREMLRPEELRELVKRGYMLGLHGATHVPLRTIPLAMEETKTAIKFLKEWVDNFVGDHLTMSLPHGYQNRSITLALQNLGVKLLFTSQPHLNRSDKGHINSRTLGRIEIGPSAYQDDKGHFSPGELSTWLFTRRIV